MLILGSLAIFLAAVSLIGLGSIWAIRFAGMAGNKNRPLAQRRLFWLGAAGSMAGVVAAGLGGFYGILAFWYLFQKHAAGAGG
jgi:hypothetical protein